MRLSLDRGRSLFGNANGSGEPVDEFLAVAEQAGLLLGKTVLGGFFPEFMPSGN